MDLHSMNYFLPLYAVAKTIGSSAAEKLPLIASANTCICEKAVGLEALAQHGVLCTEPQICCMFSGGKNARGSFDVANFVTSKWSLILQCKSKVVAAKCMFAIAKYAPLQLQTVILQQ